MGHIIENTPGNIGATLHGSRGGGSLHLLTESYDPFNTSTINHSGASAGDMTVYHTPKGSDQQSHLLGQTPSPEQQWTATYMTSHGTGSSSSSWQGPPSLNHWGTPEEATGSSAYWQSQGTDMEDDSGTETDTSPDKGHEEIDMSDLNGLNHG